MTPTTQDAELNERAAERILDEWREAVRLAEITIADRLEAVPQTANAHQGEAVAWREVNPETGNWVTWMTPDRPTPRAQPLYASPALTEPEGWRGIESAPKDGTWVILWMAKPMPHGYASEGPHPVIAKWEVDEGTGRGCWDVPFEDAWFPDADFSGWMPLPASPTVEER
jgi:hypothetical protein